MSGTVLDDVTSDSVDAQHIQRRVDDWEQRLNNLYEMISNWLPDGWQAHHGKPVIMHERMMRKFGIAAKQIPTLKLFNQSGDSVKLEPRGTVDSWHQRTSRFETRRPTLLHRRFCRKFRAAGLAGSSC